MQLKMTDKNEWQDKEKNISTTIFFHLMITSLFKVWLNIAKLSYRAAEKESWVQHRRNGKKKLIAYAEHIMPNGLEQQF